MNDAESTLSGAAEGRGKEVISVLPRRNYKIQKCSYKGNEKELFDKKAFYVFRQSMTRGVGIEPVPPPPPSRLPVRHKS
jgi:hypothetical protein